MKIINWEISFLAMGLFFILPSLVNAQGGLLRKVGPDAVWQGDEKKLIEMVIKECREQESGMIGECLYDVLEEEEAPPEVLAFVKRIDNDGYLSEYRQAGPVGIAYVIYPFRANENQGYLLVNGNPPAVNVDDLSMLDQEALERDSTYGKLKRRFPDIMLWGGDRHAKENILEETRRGGGVRLVFVYRFLKGCRACQVLGNAWYAFDFNKDGTFIGAKLLRTKSLVKLDRKSSRR